MFLYLIARSKVNIYIYIFLSLIEHKFFKGYKLLYSLLGYFVMGTVWIPVGMICMQNRLVG